MRKKLLSLLNPKSFRNSSFTFIALLGGILMGLTTAPVGAFPLAWIALAPLWVLVTSSQTKKQLILYSFAWGIGYHGLALFWLTGIHPMTWMGVPWLASLGIAFFAWSFVTLWGVALVLAWSTCLVWINKTVKFALIKVLIGTALWCALENFWSLGPLWWSSLSYTQSPHNLAILHLSQISGPSTVTAAIVAINGLIAQAWIHRNKIKLSSSSSASSVPLWFNNSFLNTAIALLFILHIIGFALYSVPLKDSPTAALKVGIIQGNIPNEIKLYPGGWSQAIAGYTSGYQTLASQGVDAVLTPETALPFQLTELKRGTFYSAILDKGVTAWLGAFGTQGNSYTNSLFTITGNGEIFSRYDKAKLVPLGEYVPFEEFLGKLINRLSPLDAHLAAGSPKQIFDTPFGRAIVGICYESAFSEHFRRQAAIGGEFILTASNNAHYSKAMPAQHHAQDVMKAIETNRWVARATNTGYSGIVDPHGRTVWLSRINTYEVHVDNIYRRKAQTLYVILGEWLTPLLLLLSGLSWVIFKLKPVVS